MNRSGSEMQLIDSFSYLVDRKGTEDNYQKMLAEWAKDQTEAIQPIAKLKTEMEKRFELSAGGENPAFRLPLAVAAPRRRGPA